MATDFRTYLSQTDEFLCRAQHDDELRTAIARTTGQAAAQPPSPALATRLLSNAIAAFIKAAVDYADGDMTPVTRLATTDQATDADDLIAQMPAEVAELMAMALGTVTRLMIGENQAAAERRTGPSGDTHRPALHLVTRGGEAR